ncbi:MAG: hypothetical protein AABX28_00615 [Nanoarchaeota archaeon]
MAEKNIDKKLLIKTLRKRLPRISSDVVTKREEYPVFERAEIEFPNPYNKGLFDLVYVLGITTSPDKGRELYMREEQ